MMLSRKEQRTLNMQRYVTLLVMHALCIASISSAAAKPSSETKRSAETKRLEDLRTTLTQTPLPTELWDVIADYSHGPTILRTIDLTNIHHDTTIQPYKISPTEHIIGIYLIKEAVTLRGKVRKGYGISLLLVTKNNATGKEYALTFSPYNGTLLKIQDATNTRPRSLLNEKEIIFSKKPSLDTTFLHASLEQDNLHATLTFLTEQNPNPTIVIYSRHADYLDFKKAATARPPL